MESEDRAVECTDLEGWTQYKRETERITLKEETDNWTKAWRSVPASLCETLRATQGAKLIGEIRWI